MTPIQRSGLTLTTALALALGAFASADLGSPSAAAQATSTVHAPSLFGPAPAGAARESADGTMDHASRARLVSFRGDLLPAQAHGQQVSLPFFDGVDLTATIQRIDRQPLLTSWSGTIGHGNGTFVATRTGDDYTVMASTPQGSYTMRTLPDGTSQVEQADPPVDTLGNDELTAPDGSEAAAAGQVDRRRHGRTVRGGDDGSVEDILVVYTPAAEAAYGGLAGIQAEAAKNIGYTNAAYAASGVGTTARLVGVLPVTGPEYDGDQSQDLNHLRKRGDGVFDEAFSYIKQTHADSTILLEQPYTNGASCGLSFSEHNQPANFSFSVVATGDCTNAYVTFPHELGHQQGAEHDLWTLQNDPLGHGPLDAQYPYGYGYVSPDLKFNTIMSYSAECVYYTGYACQYQLFNFSNPAVSFQGAPTGTTSRNNVALLITQTRKRMARHQQSQLYPRGKVSIKPKPTVGHRVHVQFKGWVNSGVHTKVSWYRNGKKIKGAHGRSYVPTRKDAGKKLAVILKGRAKYYTPVLVGSGSRKVKGKGHKHHKHHKRQQASTFSPTAFVLPASVTRVSGWI